MCATVKKIGTHREKQDRQIFIHSASQGELLTTESPAQQFKQRSRRKEARSTIFASSTSKSHFATNKTTLSCALYLV